MERTKGIKATLPYFVVILLLHILGVVFLMIGGASHPLIIGMGVVAYTLGLRHAFDADHIAAIDNTVRKLLEQQRHSMGVGFYFSLGHSSVVFLMAVMLGLAVHWAQSHLAGFQSTGGLIGTLVSGFFLLIIGLLNLVILIQLIQLSRKLKYEEIGESQINELIESRGLIMRFVGPLFQLINQSWHVFSFRILIWFRVRHSK